MKKKIVRNFKDANVVEDIDGGSRLDDAELEALAMELGRGTWGRATVGGGPDVYQGV